MGIVYEQVGGGTIIVLVFVSHMSQGIKKLKSLIDWDFPHVTGNSKNTRESIMWDINYCSKYNMLQARFDVYMYISASVLINTRRVNGCCTKFMLRYLYVWSCTCVQQCLSNVNLSLVELRERQERTKVLKCCTYSPRPIPQIVSCWSYRGSASDNSNIDKRTHIYTSQVAVTRYL